MRDEDAGQAALERGLAQGLPKLTGKIDYVPFVLGLQVKDLTESRHAFKWLISHIY
jgi:hypothetical protein